MANYSTHNVVMNAPSGGHDVQNVQMDPRLQKYLALKDYGITKKASSSAGKDEVAVIAKVSDPAAWENLSEVRLPQRITKLGGASIVTGRISIKRLEYVRTQPFVKSMKAAQKMSKTLKATLTDCEFNAILPASFRAKGGKGVIVGIVDYGCDFVHENFQKNSKTRIKKLWDQNGSRGNSPLGYGTVYSPAELNAALGKPNPYQAIGYSPGWDAHGTHVMDIAAGNGLGTRATGLAPESDIIFVDLDGSDVPWSGEEVLDKNFGDSVQLIEAIRYIFDEAGNTPCAINISLGTNGGPHDGTTLVEQAIDSMVSEKSNRAVVLAAANSYADGIHAGGILEKNQTHDLKWRVVVGDRTENEMEIWYDKSTRFKVEVIDPAGNSLGTVEPGSKATVEENGDIIMFLSNRIGDPNNGDNVIGVFMSPRTGVWTLRLTNVGNAKSEFHAWIERDDNGQSTFLAPLNNDYTLGTISCGSKLITVGSYDAHITNTPISYFSSSGPTRDGRNKPEISAPGHAVIAARSLTRNGVTNMSGTSMAAPAVTGAIALLLAEAKARGIDLTIDDIRDRVIKAGRSANGAWDKRYGHGRISLKLLLQLPNSTAVKKAKKKIKKAIKNGKKVVKMIKRTAKTRPQTAA